MERLTRKERTRTGKGVSKEPLIDRDFDRLSEYCINILTKLADYEDLEEQGRLIKLPCKVGDTVYADSTMLPIEDMECYEDIENKIPSYFPGRVVSFRFAKRNWMKIAVKTKWLREWIDDETGPESDYIECEKSFFDPIVNDW